VNNVVLWSYFQADKSLGTILMDGEDEPRNIFKDMRVIIAQNRDKRGVINGQPAVVRMRVNNTIVLKLPQGKTVCVHPVRSLQTSQDEE
jgi:hypothetical protein